jgi:DNA-binding protein YbaB
MVSLSQAKDLFRMQREAKKVKKELKKIHVEAEVGGVKVVVNGEQEVLSITIGSEVERDAIPALLIDALNRALKKAQVVASERMQGLMGDMGIPTDTGMRGMSE